MGWLLTKVRLLSFYLSTKQLANCQSYLLFEYYAEIMTSIVVFFRMSNDNHINRVKRPKYKEIDTWFSRKSDQPSACSQPSVSTPIAIEVNEEPSSESTLPNSLRDEFDPLGNDNAIERDPGKWCPIWKYPVNRREVIQKAYIALGLCQPKLKHYPFSVHGAQNRKFNFNWFEGHPWLEYSVDQDKIYCFPCFLFDRENTPHLVYTTDGLKNWKDKHVLKVHMGVKDSPHNEAME
ncbi:uncharacterized protein LOC126787247 [Argentina anserina]|uniref:uncharacterized protein LOC126787247 n=1 Tax=Argentina anserina TaxID=57926 RepID=UPI002176916F|nr:uncharacterized protein LOC126787247 [Potentilla anserina]